MGTDAVTTYYRQTEAFFAKIQEFGYTDSDFSVRCLEWPFSAKSPKAVSDLIVIKRTGNQAEIAYAADSDGRWILSFLDDLNSGAFDALEAKSRASVAVPAHEPEPHT